MNIFRSLVKRRCGVGNAIGDLNDYWTHLSFTDILKEALDKEGEVK